MAEDNVKMVACGMVRNGMARRFAIPLGMRAAFIECARSFAGDDKFEFSPEGEGVLCGIPDGRCPYTENNPLGRFGNRESGEELYLCYVNGEIEESDLIKFAASAAVTSSGKIN